MYAWGTFRNSTGILGYEVGVETQDRPKKVTTLSKIVNVAVGSNHVLFSDYHGMSKFDIYIYIVVVIMNKIYFFLGNM